MLKWVSATSRQRARLSKAMTSTTWTRTRTWTTSNMATINFAALLLTTMLSIIVALVQPTNGFTPIEMGSAEGRKLFGGYRITPKHCRATKTLPLSDPRTNGPTICMFNHECAQRNGEVVGACMDGFLFGACCQIPSSQDLESTLLNDAQNAYYQQHQQQKLQLQQSISNPAAAQSYETYGEHQQQSQENNYHRPMQQYQHGKRPSQQQQQQHKRPPPSAIYEQDNLNKVYQQLETSTTIGQQPNDIYNQANIDKVYQQLESSSSAYGQQPDNNNNNYPATAISSSSQYAAEPVDDNNSDQDLRPTLASSSAVFDETQQQDNSQQQPETVYSSQQSEQADASDNVNSDSMSVELEHEAQLHAEPATANTNLLVSEHQPPPKFQVHKDSVKISSPSSPPHNDDFVLQVLSTLPPDHGNDHITFTTEVPMKISSHLAEHTSSESSSFEESPATQLPAMPSDKPLKSTSQQHKKQKPQKQQQHKKNQQQQQHQQQQEAHSGEEQSSQQQQQQQGTNTHHHNHLLLDEAEFTHSDITHPGADADLIEDDLQFSTGYGPQPVYVEAPSDKQPSVTSHKTSTNAAPAEDQYVLVQTISNEQLSKKPVSASASTTSSSITTHVDSIESIILQLNDSSHGPTYNVISQQTPSYGSNDDINSASKYEEQSTSYDGAAISTTLRPLAAGTTTISSAYYGEVETKRPDDYYTENELPPSQQKYTGSSQTQVPAYLEPVTTHLNPKPSPSYDTTASVEEEIPTNSYLQNEYPSSKPGDSPISTAATSYAEDTSSVLDEHTMPSSGYNDAAQSSSHATSEFNKMPAVGIAYPVDMSYMEEEGNLDAEDNGASAGYGDASQPAPVSSTEKSDTELDESYSKVPVIAGKPQRPQVASYVGVVTSQNYSPKPPQASLYGQLPEEVAVSSHTTKIQEDYSASPTYQTSKPEKYTTISYNDEAPTSTLRPSTTSRPITTGSYISSTSTPVALRPQYGSAEPTDASTSRPISGIITSSGTRPRPRPRPKPTTTRPKRPSTTGNKKTTKPGSNKKPPAQPTSSYQQDSQPSNSYTQQQSSNKRPAQTAQPTNTYSETTHRKPAQPSSTYGGENTNQKKKKPVTSTHNAEQDNVPNKQPSLASYGQQKPAKQPAYVYQQQQQKKPAPPSADSYNVPQPSNNYNAGSPTKKPASPQSSNYHQQQQHYVEQDSSYGQNVKLPAQPSLSNNYQQQQHIEPDSSYGQNVKLPAQPSLSNNYQQQEHIEPDSSYGQNVKLPAQPSLSNNYQQQQHIEPDSSYGQNVKLPAQPSLSNNYQQQQHIEPDSSYGQNIKLPALTYNQDQHIASSPTRRPSPTSKPPSKKPVSTSYVTGPSSPRPPTTFHYHDEEVPPLVIAHDKLDSFVQSTTATVATAAPTAPSYAQSIYLSSVTPVHVQRPQNGYKKPGFVKVQATVKPPVPTVLITPKPTVINLITASSWGTQSQHVNGNIDSAYPSTTPIPLSSTSYVYSPLVTRRPEFTGNTPEYVSLPAVTSNDFDDPGYYGAQNVVHPAFAQATTEAVFGVPSDDRPAFPGYYGPTPTYPAFVVPGEKVGAPVEEETFTSPNDFVNFPPVRNPNLNMSASSSAVTTDLELSTPAFVEDVVLKDKMNTLVHKIVESLQDNFEALADMIDETNHTAAPAAPAGTYHSQSTASSASTTGTRRPTRKPTTRVTTAKPKATTKRPATRATTKTPTRRPTSAVTRRTTTTRKPATRKPTRRTTTTTTSAPAQDELVDEEDEEDVNPSDNEIGNQEELLSGAGGRKFKCGVRPHIKSGRIVGGKGSTFGAYPWQVLVRESTWLGLFTKNKCGGVLITNRYVITAAHCQPGFLASLVAVLGEFDISGDLESKRAVTKNVKRVIVHRQYDPATFENDLALLELESPVQYDTHIVPICMPNDHADFTGRMATVTGWGRLKYGGGVPSVLQEVQVPIIENSVCQEMFHTAGHNKKILGSFLCAGYANGQKDSCEGDSGGPLVLQRPDGRYELAGTVSHGIKCAAPYLPGVYMRTTFYKPWLRSITGVK